MGRAGRPWWLCGLCLCASVVQAQIVTDGSAGPLSRLDGARMRIEAELGRRQGGNLFHSFAQFHIPQGAEGRFVGPQGISRILARVSGAEGARIDGRLASEIPGADLYLFSPAGIVFGPGARLDLQGALHASTATRLEFSDGRSWQLDGLAPPPASDAAPSRLQFAAAAGEIQLDNSMFEAAGGRALDLSAPGLRLIGPDALLIVPNGQIALRNPVRGELPAQPAATEGAPQGNIWLQGVELNVRGQKGGGEILLQGGRLYLSDSRLDAAVANGASTRLSIEAGERLLIEDSLLATATIGRGTAGELSLRAPDLALYNSQLFASSEGAGPAGRMSLQADTLQIDVSQLRAGGDTQGGRAGSLQMAARTIEIGPQVLIEAGSDSLAPAGTVTMQASERIVMRDQREAPEWPTVVHTNSGGGGEAGQITLRAPQVVLDGVYVDNNLIDGGGGGRILVQAEQLSLDRGARIAQLIDRGRDAQPPAGRIDIETGTLSLRDGGHISTESFHYDQPGGAIRVLAREGIEMVGRGEPRSSSPGSDAVSTGIFSYGGDVSVQAPQIELQESAAISSRSWNDLPAGTVRVDTARLKLLSGSQLNTDSMGSSLYDGPGGRVELRASESVIIDGESGDRRSGISNGTRSNGNAGSTLVVTPFLSLDNRGAIVNGTGVFGRGAAGTLEIEVDRLWMGPGAGLSSASAGYGGKGTISVTARERIDIDDGYISAFGSGGEGTAGDILLTAPQIRLRSGLINTETDSLLPGGRISLQADRIVLEDISEIRARALGGPANAGDVTLNARELRLADSWINTESERGGGGNIAVNARSTQLLGNSALSASVRGGPDSAGGNVRVAGDNLLLLGDSRIIATATEGFGGYIAVDTTLFLHDRESLAAVLDASSGTRGNDGTVAVSSPVVDVSGVLVALPQDEAPVLSLVTDRCAPGGPGRASRLLVLGRGGLPGDSPQPGREGGWSCAQR